VAFLGDDFLGVGASSDAKRWTSLVCADFGWTEKDFGFGGTGYSTGGTLAGGTPYTARIAALVATAPSIVIVAGGRFDIESPNGPTKIKNGVTATFTALRAALPNATIIAENPLWSLTKPPATLALVAADVKAAVAAVHGRYLDIGQPLVGVPADLGPHTLPNDAGYALLAKAFETAYRS
jgi:lysophospholipase L1-like esterase